MIIVCAAAAVHASFAGNCLEVECLLPRSHPAALHLLALF
jgi:hypothetical protein